MRTLLLLVVSSLALPSGAAERRAAKPGAMAVRRAAPHASAMSLRRSGGAPAANPAPSAPSSIPDPGAGAPASAPPALGPRITPPSGTTVPAHDLRKNQGVRYDPADPARPGVPAPMIRDEALAAFQGAVQGAAGAAPAGAPAARVLQAGSDGRSVGGASDPVVFLTEGGSVPETGTHNRDQGGKPADPPSKGNGK